MKKVAIVFVIVALSLLACGGEEGVTPRVPDRYEPTSPALVLENVETSFAKDDILLLKAVLSERFVFHFDPNDVGRSPPGGTYVIPETWSYYDFWKTVERMFYLAHSISISIPTGGVGTPGANETEYEAGNVPITLLVMVNENNGYIVDRGYCDYAFESYASAAGKKYWRLTGWWDFTSGYADERPGVEPTSLGRILALYYRAK